MKIPLVPPNFRDLSDTVKGSMDENHLSLLLTLLRNFNSPVTEKGEYTHWDKLRHLEPPDQLTSEQWWFAIKNARNSLYKKLPFVDTHNKPFIFAMFDALWKELHDIDRSLGNVLQKPGSIVNDEMRNNYLTESLMEEAITSSQLEGASTTRRVAKKMLLSRRKPKTSSEQMIFNNYEAMQFVREMKNEKLSEGIILELHRILTKNTLDDPTAEGKLRQSSDNIRIVDNRDNTILHTPPKAKELKIRIKNICDFANQANESDKYFIHPIIKAILLHFMLAYDHPFIDGNGRCARALFYWSMAQQDYWLMEFISISTIIKKASGAYAKSFLYTETDDNDVTYFIIHQLDVIKKSINLLHDYLVKMSSEIKYTEEYLSTNDELQNKLNHRQIALIKNAFKHPDDQYFISGHQQLHNITYQTARTDLLTLVELGLFLKRKIGKAFVFIAPDDLKLRIKNYK